MPQRHQQAKRGRSRNRPSILPETSSDALWNHAREVDAAFVKTIDATADQAGRANSRGSSSTAAWAKPGCPCTSRKAASGTLTLDAGTRALATASATSSSCGSKEAAARTPTALALRPGESASGVIPSMEPAQPLAEFTRKIADDLAARLAESGLFAKEARAMVNTWKTSYFQTEGIRVLFVLPQSWTDAFIPMRIEPQPRKIVRVMVGRLEMLSADRQRKAEAAIASLASGDPGETGQAYRFLRDQGRYVEPIIRHVAKTTSDEQVRALCRRLLLTDFVTDLRAAIHNASDGKPLERRPVAAAGPAGPAAPPDGPGLARPGPKAKPCSRRSGRYPLPPGPEDRRFAARDRDQGGRARGHAATTARPPRPMPGGLNSSLEACRRCSPRADSRHARLVGRPRLCGSASCEAVTAADREIAFVTRSRDERTAGTDLARQSGRRGCCWRFCSRPGQGESRRCPSGESMVSSARAAAAASAPASEPGVPARKPEF